MNCIKIICETPLPHPCGLKYRGTAFDGCHYYMTSPDTCEVVEYDSNFCIVEIIKTLKPYTCICFDPDRKCFWAASAKYPRKLFKIDLCLKEIDSIRIPLSNDSNGAIVGVSYDCVKKGLLICGSNCVIFLCPDAPRDFETVRKPCAIWNMGITAVAPSYLLIEAQNSKQSIGIYDCTSSLMGRCEVPLGYTAEAVIFAPCNVSCTGEPHFYLLATKNGSYPYMLDITITCCEPEICHCNYTICRQCSCPPKPTPPHPPHKKDVCADLMESVALIETALSHVLNAEGEKLQKIIAITDDVDKILEVNKSIQDTIVSAMHLEIILHNKLLAIKSCCNHCDDNKCCCDPCDDDKCCCDSCECDECCDPCDDDRCCDSCECDECCAPCEDDGCSDPCECDEFCDPCACNECSRPCEPEE